MFPGPDYAIQSAPKIYIYDLPAYSNCQSHVGGENLIYGAEQILPKALRQSQIYVTTNPEEADFFYVDAHLYCIKKPGGRYFLSCIYLRIYARASLLFLNENCHK